MIKINLVPVELLIQQRRQRQLAQAAAAGAFALLFILCVSLLHWNTERRLTKEYAAADAKMKKLQVIVDQVNQLEATNRGVQARLSAIENLLKGRFLYPAFLGDLVESVPPGVWLLNLTTSSADSQVAFSTSAMARSKEDVAQWVRTLEKDGKFNAVELGTLSRSGASAYSFSVKGQYQFTPTAEMAGGLK